jgi:nucleoside-diphosphate-sugar epimerase
MRITVFGANGPTGRLLTAQALEAGHRVTAVTRQPDAFPLHHARLEVVGADVLDAAAVDAAVADHDAVLSALGVPASKEPIDTYSQGVGNIVAAMSRHRTRRLVVVSSSGVDPQPYSDGGIFFNRLLLPYVTRVLGRTMYDDMRRMEAVVRVSDVDWTIVRPSGLYHLPSVTSYRVVQGHADGRFTARVDLAASMLAMLDDSRFHRTTVGVVTTVDNPTLLQWIRDEARAHESAGATPRSRRMPARARSAARSSPWSRRAGVTNAASASSPKITSSTFVPAGSSPDSTALSRSARSVSLQS